MMNKLAVPLMHLEFGRCESPDQYGIVFQNPLS